MRTLYPPITPYREHTLAVDTLHTLHIEECGNPEGIPAVFLHGGPGAGVSPTPASRLPMPVRAGGRRLFGSPRGAAKGKAAGLADATGGSASALDSARRVLRKRRSCSSFRPSRPRREARANSVGG